MNEDPNDKAEKTKENLINEAKTILNLLLKTPKGFINPAADRFIECIIGAAVLEATLIITSAFSNKK